jgi:chromosomal replication initiator protein
MRNFNKKYRSVDLLLIDDIQFFEKSEKSQEALFHLFNDLFSANKQVVISSDRPLKNLHFLDERLTSRFASGMVVSMDFPSLEDRIAILQLKADFYLFKVSGEVLSFLAELEKHNMRVLVGMLKTVAFYAKLNNTECNSIALAKEALKDSVITSSEHITISSISEACCEFFKIKLEDMVSKKRNKEIVVPRQYAMYLITQLLPNTPLSVIGDFFNRDHTTVINARDKIGRLVNEETSIRTIVDDLKSMVLHI